jgi:hypothetical protein
MFGEGFEGEVGVEVVERGEWGVGVGEAGVGEAGEGVVVAVWGAESAFAIFGWEYRECRMRPMMRRPRRGLRAKCFEVIGERATRVAPTQP